MRDVPELLDSGFGCAASCHGPARSLRRSTSTHYQPIVYLYESLRPRSDCGALTSGDAEPAYTARACSTGALDKGVFVLLQAFTRRFHRGFTRRRHQGWWREGERERSKRGTGRVVRDGILSDIFYIPSYTFIYLYIPSYTFIDLQIAPYTFIYHHIH